ncbi:phytoene desaturase family protein [Deinococcus altitudinis]|uniref:phytoene desaturase family protein n=1 Tax=Deinococcus altitudinis TaxID=468914 RepID=UPI003891266A
MGCSSCTCSCGGCISPPGSVGIIGGGIAGLSLAALLAQRGNRVTVYEAHEPGGKLRRFTHEGLRFDTGPSLFTFPGVWRRLLSRLVEADPLDLRPLPGGLGTHHTPFGSVPLPVPTAHPLYPHWRRYVDEVAPLLPHVETLLTTPPHLTSAAFLRASTALGRVTFPHPSAESWLRSRRFPPALHHALAVHSLNAGVGPGQGSVLYALLPALMAGDVSRPAKGMGAVLDALLAFCAARDVQVLSQTPVTDLRELAHHDRIVSAVDPSRLARLLGERVPDRPLTVSGVALYARLPEHLRGRLLVTSVVTPSDYARFAAAMQVRALPPDTLALVHADASLSDEGQLALLLTAPASGRAYAVDHPWVQGQVRRVEEVLGVSGLLSGDAGVLALTPEYFVRGGAVGGAIYGQAWPAWRSGPFHPQPYRRSGRLWQVGTGVHPGGGLPAVLGGALIVDRLMNRA